MIVDFWARLLKSSNRFTAYRSYPIELKLGRMILDIIPHKLSTSDFSISQGGAVGARFLSYLNRSTAYSSHAIELKLGRMILDISPHNRSESDFPVSFKGQDFLGARDGLRISKIFCGRHLYMFPGLAGAKISLSSI